MMNVGSDIERTLTLRSLLQRNIISESTAQNSNLCPQKSMIFEEYAILEIIWNFRLLSVVSYFHKNIFHPTSLNVWNVCWAKTHAVAFPCPQPLIHLPPHMSLLSQIWHHIFMWPANISFSHACKQANKVGGASFPCSNWKRTQKSVVMQILFPTGLRSLEGKTDPVRPACIWRGKKGHSGSTIKWMFISRLIWWRSVGKERKHKAFILENIVDLVQMCQSAYQLYTPWWPRFGLSLEKLIFPWITVEYKLGWPNRRFARPLEKLSTCSRSYHSRRLIIF